SQYFLGVPDREEIDSRRVLTFYKRNFQLPHEASCRHPEVISYHDDALHQPAVTLPQSLHKVGIQFLLSGVEPLLELVEDDHQFLCDRKATSAAEDSDGVL